MTYEEKDAAKRKAYQELTDTLSHDQMQLLNVILDASDVCPTCRNTYPDNIAMDEPMHPRYVAGYKAGHRAGRRRGPVRTCLQAGENPRRRPARTSPPA